MPIIETERWIPSPDKPGTLIYDGQRTAYEVFEAIRQHLDSMGYLPDEYFLLDSKWRDGAPFPKDGYITQKVDFGGSEGIYLDIDLHWRDEDNERHQLSFLTGKTLGESAEDMNRMHLAASAITLAFQDGSAHSRYIQIGGADKTDGLTIHLNGEERQFLADGMLDIRGMLKARGEPYEMAEQLIRRTVGSITEYMRFVGEKPLYMDDFDKAVLAIQEYNLDAFHDTYPKIPDKLDELLVHAAGQPGRVGHAMTEHLLMDAKDIHPLRYLDACKKAVRTGDIDRVGLLLEKAGQCSSQSDKKLCGAVMYHAYGLHGDNFSGYHIASKLLDRATPEQAEGIPCALVARALERKDTDFAYRLIRKGIDFSANAGQVFYTAAANGYSWIIKEMRDRGVDIDAQAHQAMYLAARFDRIDAARALLDNGADFDGFMAKPEIQRMAAQNSQFFEDLQRYHESQSQEDAPQQGISM